MHSAEGIESVPFNVISTRTGEAWAAGLRLTISDWANWARQFLVGEQLNSTLENDIKVVARVHQYNFTPAIGIDVHAENGLGR